MHGQGLRGGKNLSHTKRRTSKLSIAIPASMVSEHVSLREKTEVIGRVARSAAIFRAEEIVIYTDQPDESPLIKLILAYMETPQYLRKHLYKVRSELQYAGALPPLRTPHHQLESHLSDLNVGDYREGVLLDVEGTNAVDIGVEKPIRLIGRAPSYGSRITVKVTQVKQIPLCEMVKKSEIPFYWGYEIQVSKKSLSELTSGGFYNLKLSTSRGGANIIEQADRVKERINGARKIFVAFGSPRRGIAEILEREGKKIEDCFDYNLNTMPEQGCDTVRTDEAIHATLAILNIL